MHLRNTALNSGNNVVKAPNSILTCMSINPFKPDQFPSICLVSIKVWGSSQELEVWSLYHLKSLKTKSLTMSLRDIVSVLVLRL